MIVLLDPLKLQLLIVKKSKNLLITREMAIIGSKTNVCPKPNESIVIWIIISQIFMSTKDGEEMSNNNWMILVLKNKYRNIVEN